MMKLSSKINIVQLVVRNILFKLCLGVCCQGSLGLVSRWRLNITARQYGEVVLPDASTGQGPGTLATKLSRCKEGMARVFAVRVQILLSITRVAVQTISEPEICHGAGF